MAFEPYSTEAGPRTTSTRSASIDWQASAIGCPISPMYWGWPSISTSRPVVGPPPTPRSVICPAAPPETPYPMMPRPVTNSPGICSVSVGSSDGWNPSAIFCRPTTEMVIGRCRTSVSCRVPLTTTSPIG